MEWGLKQELVISIYRFNNVKKLVVFMLVVGEYDRGMGVINE